MYVLNVGQNIINCAISIMYLSSFQKKLTNGDPQRIPIEICI